MLSKTKRKTFEVGDRVLVSDGFGKKKAKKIGKSLYQYTGIICEVSKCEMYYRVTWSSCPPPNAKEGETSKKRFRWDQLLLQLEGEQEEVVMQHFLMADSYNTSEVVVKLKYLKKVWRQQTVENGDELEVLCSWKDDANPTWERVSEVGDSQQYADFLSFQEYHEELREQNREEEEKDGRFEVETIFRKKQGWVLVLWKNWNEPSWEPLQTIKHLQIYKDWKKKCLEKGKTFLLESNSDTENDE